VVLVFGIITQKIVTKDFNVMVVAEFKVSCSQPASLRAAVWIANPDRDHVILWSWSQRIGAQFAPLCQKIGYKNLAREIHQEIAVT
jgi:hypothetical protein